MKVFRSIIFTIFVCSLAVFAVSAQDATTAKKPYQNIVIEKFTIKDGVDFPADKIDELAKSLTDTLTRSNRFTQVTMADAATDSADVPTLKITGEITKYIKGNRVARYMIGLGAGRTKIISDMKFIDVKTGEVVYQQSVDGDVIMGFFGGDSNGATDGVANEIIRVMKKHGLAGEKMKKK